MAWAVNKYQDVLKQKEKPEKDRGAWEHWLYFDTEKEAAAFIVDRANRALEAADKAMRLAETRVKKCEKKFLAR